MSDEFQFVFASFMVPDKLAAVQVADRLKELAVHPVIVREVSSCPVEPEEAEEFEELPGHDVRLSLLKIEHGQTPLLEELEDLRNAFLQAKRVADAAAGAEAAIVSMVHDPIKGFSTSMSHWAGRLLATHLAKDFTDGGGINYLAVDMVPCEVPGEKPVGPLTLLIQRKLGKSPAQVNGELMVENEKLRAELATLKGEA